MIVFTSRLQMWIGFGNTSRFSEIFRTICDFFGYWFFFKYNIKLVLYTHDYDPFIFYQFCNLIIFRIFFSGSSIENLFWNWIKVKAIKKLSEYLSIRWIKKRIIHVDSTFTALNSKRNFWSKVQLACACIWICRDTEHCWLQRQTISPSHCHVLEALA